MPLIISVLRLAASTFDVRLNVLLCAISWSMLGVDTSSILTWYIPKSDGKVILSRWAMGTIWQREPTSDAGKQSEYGVSPGETHGLAVG